MFFILNHFIFKFIYYKIKKLKHLFNKKKFKIEKKNDLVF